MFALHSRQLLAGAWFALALSLLALCPGTSAARDLIQERAYWTDLTGKASFEEAHSANYTAFEGVFGEGFGPQVQWIRLTLAGVPGSGSSDINPLVLRIRPVYLDQITLYDSVEPLVDQGKRVSGDLTAWDQAEFPSLHHAFVIPAQPSPRQVWLRLATTSSQLMHAEAFSMQEIQRDEVVLGLLYDALLTVIFSTLIWALMAWVRDRDTINGLFMLRQMLLLLYTASYLGYHRLLLHGWLEPATLSALYSWLVVCVTAVSFFFEYLFLSQYRMPRWAQGLFGAILLLSLTIMGLLATGHTVQGLRLNTLLVGWGVTNTLVIAWCITPRPTQIEATSRLYLLPKSMVVGYYTAVFLVLIVSVLPTLGLLQGSALALYGVLYYGLIVGIMMAGLLVVRSRHQKRLEQEVANQLFLSNQQLALERHRRQDQSQLLSMLMHELKTPLSIIDMAVSTHQQDGRTSRYVHRAIDSIKTILDRCIQTDRMVEGEFVLQMRSVPVSESVTQWLTDLPHGGKGLVMDLASGLVVQTDPECLRIIVQNLIENAWRHGDAQASVNVQLIDQTQGQGQAGVVLRVFNLPGASGWPDPLSVFNKYYRSPGAQSKSGTGLGLYLSNRLANKLGGILRLIPDSQHIIFELWLPA